MVVLIFPLAGMENVKVLHKGLVWGILLDPDEAAVLIDWGPFHPGSGWGLEAMDLLLKACGVRENGTTRFC